MLNRNWMANLISDRIFEREKSESKKIENLYLCYTQRRRDNFPWTQFFLDKLLCFLEGSWSGDFETVGEIEKGIRIFCGSLSPSENRSLGEKALSGQMLLTILNHDRCQKLIFC